MSSQRLWFPDDKYLTHLFKLSYSVFLTNGPKELRADGGLAAPQDRTTGRVPRAERAEHPDFRGL
jgi:hypothetical protein